ncbi:hypothetical protein [Pseudomonas sp. 31 E 6]|nr:hypothetical protein [Pseudomonas sp. 31 E 5]CRM81277.1 hypothetical protein [Pseudomonas sp. 31 E 6]
MKHNGSIFLSGQKSPAIFFTEISGGGNLPVTIGEYIA